MQRIFLVTGATSGIGRSVALRLAGPDATVCVCGRNGPALDRVALEIKARGAEAACYRGDLADDADIRRMLEEIRRDYERIDAVVHSAGIILPGRIDVQDVGSFDLQYRVNVRAPFLLTQQLLPMLHAASGQVVFVNSTAGLSAKGGLAQYSATKHALRAFADGLREEVNALGIRVISVFPGRTDTPMQSAILKYEGREMSPDYLLSPEDVAEVVVNALTMPRNAEITDITLRPMRKGA